VDVSVYIVVRLELVDYVAVGLCECGCVCLCSSGTGTCGCEASLFDVNVSVLYLMCHELITLAPLVST